MAWNELTTADGQLRWHCLPLGRKIQQLTPEWREGLAHTAERMVEDLGSTFNVFSDVGGTGQPYQLDPLPLVIPPGEWTIIADGLRQRMRLLEAVLSDIYGPQTLLTSGLIPPDLVHANEGYFRSAWQVSPAGGRMLWAAGCDLVRGPDGLWRVLADHTGAPGGLGQVYENRNVVATLLAGVFDEMKVARLRDFLGLERELLQTFGPKREDSVGAVFLTPGFRNPSYFEHAYKARLLGIPLVEPADLTVRERRLYLKTLSGLRRVDGLLCRIDPASIDPLEVWGGQGGEGVPGLVEVWRTGNVGIANGPGAGFASCPALMPFLPKICEEWFGEELILPFVETWWLGHASVREMLAAEMPRFVLMSTAASDASSLPVNFANLSPSARRKWLSIIAERPQDFVVQQAVVPSEMATVEGRFLRSRPVVWRAFTLNTEHGAEVLPGGMARVGKQSHPPQMWPRHAGFTKDVWIPDLELADRAEVSSPKVVHDVSASAAEVPSRIADQMFWVGRYAERLEAATRMLRTTLRCAPGEVGKQSRDALAASLALVSGSPLLPDDWQEHAEGVVAWIGGMIHDPAMKQGLTALTRGLLENAAAARDRLSDDTWRLFNQLEAVVRPPAMVLGAPSHLRTLDTLIVHLAAFAGMQAENMTRGHGWRFLETGRRIERALITLNLLATASSRAEDTSPLFEPLLEICDSSMTYRRRHYSRPRSGPVMQLLFFEESNPRSVAYQIRVLRHETRCYPGDTGAGLMPEILSRIDDFHARFAVQGMPDAAELQALAADLEHVADQIGQHFFSHSVRRVY